MERDDEIKDKELENKCKMDKEKTDSKEDKERMVEVKAKVLEEVLDKTKEGDEELDKAMVLEEEK